MIFRFSFQMHGFVNQRGWTTEIEWRLNVQNKNKPISRAHFKEKSPAKMKLGNLCSLNVKPVAWRSL